MGGRNRRSWAAFMEEALYDPDHGFFTTSPVGREFATAPHLSPVFAACIASLLASVETALGTPITFAELGAGDGTLAHRVAKSAPQVAKRTSYVAIERDEEALGRARQRSADAWRSAGSHAAVGSVTPIRGLVFANEVFDNVPFHRLRGTPNGVREVFVDASQGLLVEVEDEPGVGVLEATSRLPEVGEERPSSPAARALLRDALERIDQGWFVTLDYGITAEGPSEPVRAYRGHLLVDPLKEPIGSCDITGPVDIDALVAEAGGTGRRVTLMRQGRFLEALGYAGFTEQLEQRGLVAQHEGDVAAAMNFARVRRAAEVLVHPDEMGAFFALIVAVGDVSDLPFHREES